MAHTVTAEGYPVASSPQTNINPLARTAFLQEMERFANTIGENIKLIWCDGTVKTRTEEEIQADGSDFVIFDFSMPMGIAERIDQYDVILGDYSQNLEAPGNLHAMPLRFMNTILKVGSTNKYRFPTPPGHPNQRCLFQMDYKTVWITTPMRNLTRSGDYYTEAQMATKILCPIFQKAMDKSFFENLEAEHRETVLSQFRSSTTTLVSGKQQAIQERVTRLEEQNAKLFQQITATEVLLREASKDLAAVSTVKNDEVQYVLDGITALYGNKRVITVGYDSNNSSLVIYTDQLYLYSPDRSSRALLGEFEIRYRPNDREVKITNLHNRKRDRHHPHIPSSGMPCWGGHASQVLKMLMDQEMYGFVDFTIGFLENYNPNDSWGTWGAWWFTEEETEYKVDDNTYMTKEQMKQDKIEMPTQPTEDELLNALNL